MINIKTNYLSSDFLRRRTRSLFFLKSSILFSMTDELGSVLFKNKINENFSFLLFRRELFRGDVEIFVGNFDYWVIFKFNFKSLNPFLQI